MALRDYTRMIQSSNNINYCRFVISSPRITTVDGVVSSDFKSSNTINYGIHYSKDEIKPNIGGGSGGGTGGENFGGGGGVGSGGEGGEGKNEGEGESSDDSGKKKMGMSMSQKLTLGYAALVGVGGLMGYLKSGTQKSLVAEGVSALLLYYVYTQLPTQPVLAPAIGLVVAFGIRKVSVLHNFLKWFKKWLCCRPCQENQAC